MLTEWPLEDLVGTGRKKYIYEVRLLGRLTLPFCSNFIIQLFENQSVVEYWENFASHAFENATQSVYSHCVLLKPSGAPVPSTFCFSIRRDLFDLPSIVIGAPLCFANSVPVQCILITRQDNGYHFCSTTIKL